MYWNAFYSTLARLALRVDIVEGRSKSAHYFEQLRVPSSILYSGSGPIDASMYAVPFLECRIAPDFDLDKMFFAAIDKAVLKHTSDPKKNHVVTSMGDMNDYLSLYFNCMEQLLNEKGFAPSRIFVSDDISREITYNVIHNDARYDEIKLVDDVDERLFAKWRNCKVYRTNKIAENLMYMTTFADFLGVIPIHVDSSGPTELGMGIFQHYGIAKVIL